MASKPTKPPAKKPLATNIAEFHKQLTKEDKAALIDLTHTRPITFIPTGSWPINTLIGDGTMTGKPGGFPRGHISEVFGDESSGKSTLILSSIREAQNLGEHCVLLDYEQTFHALYAQNLGVKTTESHLSLFQPRHFQQGARIIARALAGKPGLIAIDSVAAMTPKQYIEKDIDEEGRIGALAGAMTAFLTIITKDLQASNVALVMTNQMRKVINMNLRPGQKSYGPTEESTGGYALKYYLSLRLKMMKGEIERVERISHITGKAEKEPVNVTTRVTVVKNKIDKPYFWAPVYIRFGEGFDNIKSIIELAINTETVKRNGTFFTFTHAGEQVFKAQGKADMWRILSENEKTMKLLQSSLVFSEDKVIKEEYKNDEEGGPSDDKLDALEASLDAVVDNQIQKRQQKAAAKAGAEPEPTED